MIYIRYTISKISFSFIMYITIILCRNYLQIVRSNYVYFGQINESVCLSVCLSVDMEHYNVSHNFLSYVLGLNHCNSSVNQGLFLCWITPET